MHPYYSPYPGPPSHPGPPAGYLRRPRWWIALAVAVGLGSVGVPVLAVSLYVWFLLVPPLLVVLAVGVTVCAVLGRTRPTADAVALGLLLAPAVSALGLGLLLATGNHL